MFGLLKRSDVERAIKEAREDMYRSNIANLAGGELREQLIKIAKRAGRAVRPKIHQKRCDTGLTDG